MSNIQFSKEVSDFIKSSYGCKDDLSKTQSDGIDSTYFNSMVFIQKAENKGTEIFDEKHLSELPKEDMLEILRHFITKHF